MSFSRRPQAFVTLRHTFDPVVHVGPEARVLVRDAIDIPRRNDERRTVKYLRPGTNLLPARQVYLL